MVDANDRLMMIAANNNVDDWFSFLGIMKNRCKHVCKCIAFSFCEERCCGCCFAQIVYATNSNSHRLPGSCVKH